VNCTISERSTFRTRAASGRCRQDRVIAGGFITLDWQGIGTLERKDAQLPYRIEYVRPAIEHLRYLTARQRSIIFTGVDGQLRHEPTLETRNRKQMHANPLASWELRLGDLRVYYDVEEKPEQLVKIAAIGIKDGHEVIIGRERIRP
jgi:mRNA-degrading endonuclease RelE of RelBE toxin-antitoxin system